MFGEQFLKALKEKRASAVNLWQTASSIACLSKHKPYGIRFDAQGREDGILNLKRLDLNQLDLNQVA